MRGKKAYSTEVDVPITTKGNVFMFLNFKRDWLLLLLGTTFMAASAASTPIATLVYGNIIGALSNYYLGTYSSYDVFIRDCLKLCGILMAVGLAKMVSVWLGMSLWLKFGETQQSCARSATYNSLLKKDTKWYDNNPNIMGELTQVNRCIEELRSGNAEIMAETVQTVALIVGLIIMSFYQSWAITLIITASAPVMALCAWYFGSVTYRAQEVENTHSSNASKVLDWCLTSPLTVRVFNGKYVEMVKFKRFTNASAKAYYRAANAIAANSGILKFLTLMMFVQGFWFGNYLLMRNRITVNQLFTCFSSCLMLGQSISKISQLMAIINTAHAAASRIASHLQTLNEDCEYKVNTKKYPLSCFGEIMFSDVCFNYPARDKLILRDASFLVEPGKMNFIIGKSGAGKSTLPLLLMKLYGRNSGAITIDGIGIDSLDSCWISQNLVLLQQTPFIFNGTVRENIALAVVDDYDSTENVPLDSIYEAAGFALLDLDLETKITPLSLSGGQQQRLAIARARLKNPPVLILDEAFSALDFQTKQVLFARVRVWRRGKTTISITHDYSHIEPNDNVIMMEQGAVVKQAQFKEFANLQDGDLTTKIMTEKHDCTTNTTTAMRISAVDDIEKSDKKETFLGTFGILKYCSNTIDAKLVIIMGILISILEGGASPVFSYCFAKLLATTVEASIGGDDTQQIIQWSGMSIGIASFIGLTAYGAKFILSYASERWIVMLRKLAFEKLNGQDMSFFKEMKTAEVTTLLMNDTRDLRNLVSAFLSIIVNLVAMVLVGIIWSIISGWKLALVGFSFVPLILLITAAYSIILQSAENRYKSSVIKLETHVHQTVSSIKTIKLFSMNRYFADKFDQYLNKVNKDGDFRAIQTGIGYALNDLISAVAIGVILYYGMELTGKFEYTHGQLLQVVALLTFTLANAASLIHSLPEVTRGQRAGTYIVKLLESTPLAKIENDGYEIPKAHRNVISFNNTCFKYDDKYILRNVSFKIRKNQLVGLVGQSGSGKSTIASLLLRLIGCNSNSISIYQHDISTVNIDWLRETISIVPQLPKFFEGSILENLTYGISPTQQINFEDLQHCLRLCGVYDFVISLPEGLHTRVGEGNNTLLSGGQLQRLSIVRALIRRPKILIFDECTSNLDPVNAKLIMELIMSLKNKYTILCITHNQEMMNMADKVYILKNGTICI
ncbi:HST6 [Candida margitis]|uniref:HST6 n=1 Tax=Candida margitis TaxID=1775924 RepID=UPI0022260883|nr:HST6 [Candida margitis]KAI5961110.1 HST6 [Candida margitis]